MSQAFTLSLKNMLLNFKGISLEVNNVMDNLVDKAARMLYFVLVIHGLRAAFHIF